MKARFLRLAVFALIATLLPAAALGQVVGSIVGTVLDPSGQPMRGIRVGARSDTQIGGDKVAYSNDGGSFRIAGLQPGVFEVKATAPNLKTIVQRDVHVGVNAPAEVTIIMEVESGSEEVRVVEKAPIVSTSSATVKEVFDSEFVDGLPMDKRTGYGGFIRDTVPGAASGGDWTARVRGGNANQNGFLVEGFSMANQKITLNSLAAMEVQTAGFGAENAGFPGSVVNMVTKSGSNHFELDVGAFHEDSRLRPFNGSQDSTPLVTNSFINPAFSGPILKDRLWFYLNVEGRFQRQARGPDPAGLFEPALADTYSDVRGTLKLTWQVTPRNKVQTFTLVNREAERNARDGFNVSADAQRMRDYLDYFAGITWESLLGDTTFFKSQIGVQRFLRTEKPELCLDEPDSCQSLVPIEQSYPTQQFYGNYEAVSQTIDAGVEVVNTLESFRHTRSSGDHAIKVVSRYFHRLYENTNGVPGDMKLFYNGLTPDRRVEYFTNDPRYEDPRTGYWIRATSGFRMINSLEDAVRVTRFLTVTPGLALTTNSADADQEGGTGIHRTVFTPHLAVAWDALHDGSTVVRGSLNQYVDTDAVRIAGIELGNAVSRECRWNATTQAFDSNCRYSGGASGRTVGLPCGPTGLNPDGTSCQERLKVPRIYEYTLGAEREIRQGVGLGADLIYRRFTNPYERRETNRVWNAPGSSLDSLGSFRNGRAETVDDLATPADARRTYLAVTASLKKREGALKMTASYTWSRLQGNVAGEEDNEFGNIGPRDMFLYGYLPNDHRHEVRLSTTYQVSRWLAAGVNYGYFSGGPYSRKFRNLETGGWDDYRAPVGVNPGTNINDPGDDRPLRLPDIQRLNLQVRANLKPIIRHDVELYLDVLNLLALRTVTGVVTQDGPTFGLPTSQLDPTRTRLGLRFRY